jgi:hypothetical protein
MNFVTTLGKIRLLVQEELDRLVMRSAGFLCPGSSSSLQSGGFSELGPPPGLGSEEEEDVKEKEEEFSSQYAVRVARRKNR